MYTSVHGDGHHGTAVQSNANGITALPLEHNGVDVWRTNPLPGRRWTVPWTGASRLEHVHTLASLRTHRTCVVPGLPVACVCAVPVGYRAVVWSTTSRPSHRHGDGRLEFLPPLCRHICVVIHAVAAAAAAAVAAVRRGELREDLVASLGVDVLELTRGHGAR
eukprot:6709648-Prymnesium_polylepis.1